MAGTSQSEDRLVIKNTPPPLRRLIAAPFFIGGGYFIYHLIAALYEYARVASADEWLGAIPGMLVMLVLGFGVSLPGLFLAAGETLTVDRKLGTIRKRRELVGLHTPGLLVQLDEVEKVICRQMTKKHIDREPGATHGRSTSITVYPVDLEMKSGETTHLIELPEKAVAKSVAKSVADFAALTLDDRL